MVDTINSAISQMCKGHQYGRLGMAADLGMSIDQFHNHLYRKCGSRFFTLEELQQMEDLSGTYCLAEYFAKRRGLTLVDIASVETLDKVDLFDLEMRSDAAAGQLAIAKQEAAADGVIDKTEMKKLTGLFHQKMRHQMHGFLGFLALYGASVSEHNVDIFMANRRVEVAGMQVQGIGGLGE
ncbi:hypothetical protein LU196_13045 [Pantoea sp. Mb-10]|uniref:YmfL family putative regulatory protein n=1 Tax=unclassified Pantoea TaxID=2630326 RepID=UPI001E44A957|nr:MULTISPECIES: YmfL family putative regulatory protein [unclassified Pantoea]MCE0490966.1 hypothetical protein [Pantoea sp. Mb-10]MCE0499876.1 hypothetical protein [Pantoea sp. Pb-8]